MFPSTSLLLLAAAALLSPLASSAPAATPALQIEQAVILSRHSLRWLLDPAEEVLFPLLRDGSNVHGHDAYGPGRLTRLGKDVARRALGDELRTRYVDQLRLLPATLRTQDDFDKLGLRSSRVPRCAESLMLVLQGMYPGIKVAPLFAETDQVLHSKLLDGGMHPFVQELSKPAADRDWSFLQELDEKTSQWKEEDKTMVKEYLADAKEGDTVLAIQVRARSTETLMANKRQPGMAQLQKDLEHQAEAALAAKLDKVDAPLEKYISRETILSMRGAHMRTFLEVTQAHGLAYQPDIDAERVRVAHENSEVVVFQGLFDNAEWRTGASGRWLDELLSSFEAKIASAEGSQGGDSHTHTPPQPSVRMGWAHDVSLAMVMPYFGGLKAWPDFNDHLAVELWRRGNKRYVRLRYNQEFLELPDCADTDPRQTDKTLHPWDRFLAVYGPQRTVVKS